MVRAFLWADGPSSNNKVLRDYKITLGCSHLCRSGNHRSAQNLGCKKKMFMNSFSVVPSSTNPQLEMRLLQTADFSFL